MQDLKLVALDEEGLAVISAHAQDAVIRVADMGFARSDKRFVIMMNRFAWEHGGGDDRPKTAIRCRSAMHFDHVLDVRSRGINPRARDGVLNLLAIGFEVEDAPSGIVTLSFAGGGTIELQVECLELRLNDLGARWAARAVPSHESADE